MNLRDALAAAIEGRSLSRSEAAEAMAGALDPESPDVQIAAWLGALQARGPRAEELAGFADVLRARSLGPQSPGEGLVDTCGTGGGAPSWNLSTGGAIVAAAAGAKVAKHGNRAVTSACGSADVLEALGVRLVSDAEALGRALREVGIAFFFAPHHPPGLARVGPVRRALGVRTVFNQLGPLANPAGARRQVVGVADRAMARPMAEALALLGAERAFVVHGADGLDEVSPSAETWVESVEAGAVSSASWRPEHFGQSPVPPEALATDGTVAGNAARLQRALDVPESDEAAAIVPVAGAALLAAGLAASTEEAGELARAALRSGAAAEKLQRLRMVTE
jgi:anthranilate phosphoribosyltransferase